MTQRRLQKSLHICMILMMISGLMGALPVRAEAEPSGVLRSSAGASQRTQWSEFMVCPAQFSGGVVSI